MAEGTTTSRLSLEEVRASVRRIQARGERVVGQLRDEARELVARAKVLSLEDARRRAAEAVQQLDQQGDRLGHLLRERLAELLAAARTVLGAASTSDLAALTSRVSQLEARPAIEAQDLAVLRERLAQLEQRLEALTKAA